MDDLQKPDDALRAVLLARVGAAEHLWGEVGHRRPRAVRARRHEAGASLEEGHAGGALVEPGEHLDGVRDSLLARGRVSYHLLILGPLLSAQLGGLQESLLVLSDLLAQIRDRLLQLVDLGLLAVELLRERLLAGDCLVASRDRSLDLLVAEALLRLLRLSLSLQLGDEVVDDGPDLHKVVRRGPHLQRHQRQRRAPQARGGGVEEAQQLQARGTRRRDLTRASQLQERGRPEGRRGLLDRPPYLQVGQLSVGPRVGHNSRLKGLDGLRDRRQLRRARLRALVPELGLLLALGRQHVQERLVRIPGRGLFRHRLLCGVLLLLRLGL
mmetsp:Transcript_50401/g.130931  ORF Transcript_50401/g.130931 Transcript_50401/m.130931 type:complete len:326 (-) Transcript_50401:899-1876(-)